MTYPIEGLTGDEITAFKRRCQKAHVQPNEVLRQLLKQALKRVKPPQSVKVLTAVDT